MRLLTCCLFFCFGFFLVGCDTLGIGNRDRTVNDVPATARVNDTLRYDPSDSPTPMTANTPLPVPGQLTGTQPSATTTYPPAAPATAPQNAPVVQQSPAPMGYGNTQQPQQQPQSYGTEAAPMNAPAGAPPTYTNTATDGSATYATNPATPEAYGTPPTSVPVQYGQQQARGPATYSAAAAQIAPFLAGNWSNSADPRETVQFTPTHYYTYYDGELLVEEDMTFHPQCPAGCNGGAAAEFACFSIEGPAGTDCYGIIRLTSEVLELSLLGVSTETIVYNKVQ